VLERLQAAGVLRHLVLVGSWSLLAYRKYFAGTGTLRTLRTRDLDFLVPLPSPFKTKVDIPDLLSAMGFVLGHRGTEGYMILQHPELLVEFLVPERGRGHAGAYLLRHLGMNAQPLRFMDIALQRPIPAELFGVTVTVSHPACFALHKLLIAPRRREPAKQARDIETALEILRLLDKQGETATVRAVLAGFPKTWQTVIRNQAAQHDYTF